MEGELLSYCIAEVSSMRITVLGRTLPGTAPNCATPATGGRIPSMSERVKEYLKFGAARPPGTVWAMERAYFELRHQYPGKDEYAYL